MKKLVLVGIMLVALTGQAEAGVNEWPVVSQVLKVGACVIADAGKLTASAVRHLAGFGTEALLIVRDCLTFSVETLTPGLVPNPH